MDDMLCLYLLPERLDTFLFTSIHPGVVEAEADTHCCCKVLLLLLFSARARKLLRGGVYRILSCDLFKVPPMSLLFSAARA